MLTEKQKSILFYALEAIKDTIYFDEDINKVSNSCKSIYVNVNCSALSSIKSQKELDDFIDNTLDALC